MNAIVYRSDRKITAGEFIDVLKRSTLAARRPVDNEARIQRMLDHCTLLVTAWSGELLVGISRAITDFSYCCYLSDLAVDVAYQGKGIGRELILRTQQVAGSETKLILLSAPDAVSFYQRINMTQFSDCFFLKSIQ